MKKNVLLAALALPFLFCQACSKEKKFERSLWKNEGGWDIVTMTYTLITTDEYNNPDTLSGTAQNPGVFNFEKEGRGNYNFAIAGTPHFEAFSWDVVNSTALTLTRNAEDFDWTTGYTESIQVGITGDQMSKEELTLSGTEILENETDYGQTQSKLTATFNLRKK